jgi:hypothetical protein
VGRQSGLLQERPDEPRFQRISFVPGATEDRSRVNERIEVDPNNPQQYPPQQPQQPPYPPQQPPYPPQQPPYPPQQPPYDPNAPVVPPTWGVPAPTQPAKRGLIGSIFGSIVGRVIGILVVVAILVGGAFVYQKVVNPDHLSQVIFTSSDQTGNKCVVSDRVDTVKAGDPVYVMVMWARRLASTDKVVEEDFKDGVSIDKFDWDPTDYAGYDCTTDATNYSDLFSEPGKYELKLTVGTEVVADGTLTVTP